MVKRITNLIKEKGMSVNAVEKKLGFGNGAIKRFDKSSPSIDKIIALSNFLNVSIDYLVYGEENNVDSSNRSINFSENTDFSKSNIYNVTGDDTKFSPVVPDTLAKKDEKFSNIIEYIQSLPEREQWKAIFRLEDVLKEEFSVEAVKKNS